MLTVCISKGIPQRDGIIDYAAVQIRNVIHVFRAEARVKEIVVHGDAFEILQELKDP